MIEIKNLSGKFKLKIGFDFLKKIETDDYTFL